LLQFKNIIREKPIRHTYIVLLQILLYLITFLVYFEILSIYTMNILFLLFHGIYRMILLNFEL